MLIADGRNDALIGYAEREGETLAVYSVDKCIEVLMSDGLTYDEAIDHFSFNVEGSWLGRKTPVWVYKIESGDRERLGLPEEITQG